MYCAMIRSKIHQARVTGADPNYEGSIGIDTDLLEAAGLYPWEKVLVVDIENGNRMETYIIPDEAGSGAIQLNGVTYEKGIGAHANSTIIYNLNGEYGRFATDVGMDDSKDGKNHGDMVFQIGRAHV